MRALAIVTLSIFFMSAMLCATGVLPYITEPSPDGRPNEILRS
jgi:hypothetical protein